VFLLLARVLTRGIPKRRDKKQDDDFPHTTHIYTYMRIPVVGEEIEQRYESTGDRKHSGSGK